ncbi:MAG: 3'-5' exonuclease, partial [Pseudomonadota bacterium]
GNIGEKKSRAIIGWIKEQKVPPHRIDQWPEAGRGQKGLKALSGLLTLLSDKAITPAAAVELTVTYYEPILKEKFDDFPRRLKDLEQLVSMAGRYRRLGTFVDELVLEPPTSAADFNPEDRGDTLTLSTVHSAKGLEWPVVFIIWLTEGYFPPSKANGDQESLEEERRLMYVGATRAKDELILCYPGQEPPPAWAAYAGGGIPYRRGLSSFIQALPTDVVHYTSTGPLLKRPLFQAPALRAPTSRERSFEPAFQKAQSSRPDGLRTGDRVAHPAFGDGVISKFVDQDKVEVLFKNVGRKLLHLGYTTLEKR